MTAQADSQMKLYEYWRSTTSYRVRIVLNLKGLPYEQLPVSLLDNEQHSPAYRALNPSGAVPTLVLADGTALTQSLAIIDYLDTLHPSPSLLPDNPLSAAKTRAAALIIACDIHPVNNLKVGAQLKALGHDQDTVVAWMKHWMADGLTAFQALIRPNTPFCFGDTPDLADICLIPQLYNAHRWGLDMGAFKRLSEIEARCLALPAFAAAHPDHHNTKA